MTARTTGGLLMDLERCKGCELCIDVCPPDVLSMSEERNARGFRLPVLAAEGCTGCAACQMICPDFVFEVYRIGRDAVRMEPT
jgi:2-oxoglutarate ferredoxin oxidoreductase subunit delta